VDGTAPPTLSTDAFLDDLGVFIVDSPSPFHAVASALSRLRSAGFSMIDERQPWPAEPGRYVMVRDGSLLAYSTENSLPTRGFRVIGAHTDSPNLRIRPRPERVNAGFAQLAVEVYGGALLNSWLDRDLGLSGRVSISTGTGRIETVLVAFNEPLLRVPQLAIHLDQGLATNGLQLNPQLHLTPVWGLDPALDLRSFLAQQLSISSKDILSWELMCHDLTAPSVLGADHSMFAAPRLDNQLSCHASVNALISALDSDGDQSAVPMICLFDHEEIGSESASGAAGSLLEVVLERVSIGAGLSRDEHFAALASSICISADGAHATHPNYVDRHEPGHHITLGAGPVLKYNESRRYASDAPGLAEVIDVARDAGIALQHFSSRGDMRCGSTIGPITAARLGVRTVDLGVAQLSMHSARELCGAADPLRFATLLTELLRLGSDSARQ
jgi:aspartyl aminopeptidase